MSSKDIFWTDIVQAQERLAGTVVLYDRSPVYIERVESHDDGDTRAKLLLLPAKGNYVRKKLNSPHFHRFRIMPELGWVNPVGDGLLHLGPVFLARRTITSRSHGLKDDNVTATVLTHADGTTPQAYTGAVRFSSLIFDPGFVDSHNGSFPSLDKILKEVRPLTAIAFSKKWAVARDGDGLRWLFRDLTRVGIFTDSETLALPEKHRFLREELMADRDFTLNTIREF